MVGDPIPGVARIAVLRANAIGDFVVTLPALQALRAAYPAAEIVLLGSPMHAELLRGRPSPVDRVEVLPIIRGVHQPAGAEEDADEVAAFLARMRRRRFDLAVQLHGGGRWSNPLVRGLGATTTIGMRDRAAEPLDRWLPYRPFQHEIFRFLEVVELAGAAPVTTQPRLAVTDTDRRAAAAALGDGAGPLVAVHPGANDPRRRWPPECFAAVADAITDLGATIVVTGSTRERDLAEATAAAMRHPARVLCGALDLGGLLGLLDRCVLVVGNDSGPRHLAEAVGTATAAIYWCGNAMNIAPLRRARHQVHVSWRMACPRCGANGVAGLYPGRRLGGHCPHRQSWVDDVPVEEVLRDALALYRAELRMRSSSAVVDRAET